VVDGADHHPRPSVLELVLAMPPGGSRGLAGVLDRVCRAAVSELRLLGAVVTLMSSTETQAVSAASNATTRRLEEQQFGLGEGPTRDAHALHRPVVESDLEAAGWRRWPAFASVASEAGAGAVCALPLQIGAVSFGVLTLYFPATRGISVQDLRTGLDFAEFASAVLVNDSGPGADGGRLDLDLPAVLDTQGHIYQAQGMVMVELGVGLAEALARMRAYAYATDQPLSSLATDIVAGRTAIPRDGPGDGPAGWANGGANGGT
jgi:hypothetical protein